MPPDRAFFTHHVPRLQRVAQRQFDAARSHLPTSGKRNSKCGSNQAMSKAKPACRCRSVHHVLKVHAHKGGQQEAVVQFGAPARERLPRQGLFPEACHQARSSSCWAMLMRRGAAFQTRATPAGPAGPCWCRARYSLSMQNSLRWVLPVTSTRMLRSVRSTSHGGMASP